MQSRLIVRITVAPVVVHAESAHFLFETLPPQPLSLLGGDTRHVTQLRGCGVAGLRVDQRRGYGHRVEKEAVVTNPPTAPSGYNTVNAALGFTPVPSSSDATNLYLVCRRCGCLVLVTKTADHTSFHNLLGLANAALGLKTS